METGSQDLFDIQLKGRRVRRSFQDQGSSHALKGKCSNEGCILATVARHASSGSFSKGRTSIEGRQGNIGAGFINKYQRIRWKAAGRLSPRSTLFLVALCCPQGL